MGKYGGHKRQGRGWEGVPHPLTLHKYTQSHTLLRALVLGRIKRLHEHRHVSEGPLTILHALLGR